MNASWQGSLARPARGQPKLRPKRVVGDNGNRSKRIRHNVPRRGSSYKIPRKTNERRTEPFNCPLDREINRIERLINRLKQYRRLATRYEKRG